MLSLSNYKMFSPQAKAESSASLARVMEIQRQASSSSSSSSSASSLTWLDNFVKSRAQGQTGNKKSSQSSVDFIFAEERAGPGQTAYLDVYQNIENAAVKQTEKMKPLPTPNFPKLPGKRTKQKSSNNEAAALRLQLLQSRSGTYFISVSGPVINWEIFS